MPEAFLNIPETAAKTLPTIYHQKRQTAESTGVFLCDLIRIRRRTENSFNTGSTQS